MTDKISTLLKQGKISQFHAEVYRLFEQYEPGRVFLKNIIECILLEEPAQHKGVSFAWNDGRRSCWRELKMAIMEVNNTINGEIQNERRDSTSYRASEDRDPNN